MVASLMEAMVWEGAAPTEGHLLERTRCNAHTRYTMQSTVFSLPVALQDVCPQLVAESDGKYCCTEEQVDTLATQVSLILSSSVCPFSMPCTVCL